MSKIQGFILYRIWYGDVLVYLGRTKQPLQSRIHGHLFKKPMQRSISINLVTKIEYADKCKDELTVHLPDVEWQIFTTPLWDKWKREIAAVDKEYQMRRQEKAAKLEMDRIMRRKWHSREITEEEYYKYLDCGEGENTANIDDI